MGALTAAELIQIAIALIEYGPQFVKFIEEALAKGHSLANIPAEHHDQVKAVLARLQTSAGSPNPVVNAVTEQMEGR